IEIVKFIKSNVERIKHSSTINLDELNLGKEEIELVAIIAGSCILNGPVGVNKPCDWILLNGEVRRTTIKELLNCGSSAWKSFCRKIAKELDEVECQSKLVWGNYWPLCEIN
ncbi:hypothetical protein KII05_11465, partial [Weissella confusa]|uniref:hypothetical protein n=1 Tax=Weissella confusa TaxID=1583 RepID=UPI001BCA741C